VTRRVEALLDHLRRWAETRNDVRALALVGSHARGEARPDSDVDVVVLSTDPAALLESTDWIGVFGNVRSVAREDWGRLQSLRAIYADGMEVEFGIAPTDWANVSPDPGTASVLRAGCRILLDRDDLLSSCLGELDPGSKKRT